MKKLVIIAIIILGVAFLVFQRRQEDASWVCEDGQWGMRGKPSSAMPTSPCPQQGGAEEPKGYLETLTGGLNKAKELNRQSSTLDLHGQGITTLPTEFFEDKEHIQTFDVSRNQLTGALPAEIRKFTQLQSLDASDNKLTGIPAEIGQLARLETIDFSNNQIDTYPNEIANLADTLKTLDLTGNRYSSATLNELKALLPTTDVRH